MFQKFATAKITSVRWSAKPVKNARLASIDKSGASLLDSEDREFLTDDGYLYVTTRAISSRTNMNWDSFPSKTLKQAYQSFIGKPLFLEHANESPERARGVVVDAQLHTEDEKTASLDPYYSSADCDPEHKPPVWIECLMEVDGKTFPKLAKAIIDGTLDAVSMGCNVEFTRCSHCDNIAHEPEEFCSHVQNKGKHHDYIKPDGTKVSKKSYEHCEGEVGFFELSFVANPADETALFKGVKTASPKESFFGYDYDSMTPEQRARYEDDHQRQRVINEGREDRGGHSRDYVCPHGKHTAYEWCDHGCHEDDVPEIVDMARGASAPSMFDDAARQYLHDARREYNQALHEGAQNEEAVKAALARLKESGCDYESAVGVMQEAMRGSLPVYAKTADNDNIPQSMQQSAPNEVNTLRQDQLCPVCSSTMSDGACGVCQFVTPPEGFDNPNLQKAQQIKEQMEGEEEGVAQRDAEEQATQDPSQMASDEASAPVQEQGQASPRAASSNSHIADFTNRSPVSGEQQTKTAASEKDLRGGIVNPNERAILPLKRKPSDKPKETVLVKDYNRPVESNYQIVADATPPEGGGAQERVNLTDKGGVGLDEDHAKKDNVSREVNIDGPHTDTWSGSEGDSLGQQSPVTTDVFPKNSSADCDCSEGDCTCEDDTPDFLKKKAGPSFPDHDPARVDLLAPIAEPVGDETMTWSGTEGHTLEQANPVTKSTGDLITAAKAEVRAHIYAGLKLAETEVALGITQPEQKFARLAELESESIDSIRASLDTYMRVKKASPPRKTASVPQVPKLSLAPRTAASNAIPDADDCSDIFF